MSQLPDRLLPLAACVFAAVSVQAQTIADYSRSQRTMLETTMSQNAARAAALAAPAASAASAAAAAASMPRRPLPPPEPFVRVSGVFDGPGRQLVEINVDGASFLLTAGQAVPGTPWRVTTIGPERVVLARAPEPDAEGRPRETRRTFLLAAAR